MSFLDRFFGQSYEKELTSIAPLIPRINAVEASLTPLSDDELMAKTASFKERLGKGESLASRHRFDTTIPALYTDTYGSPF